MMLNLLDLPAYRRGSDVQIFTGLPDRAGPRHRDEIPEHRRVHLFLPRDVAKKVGALAILSGSKWDSRPLNSRGSEPEDRCTLFLHTL